jgi:segregation and condensation protein A
MNPLDPRYELVQQLLAYKRYKDAADELDRRRTLWEARFPRKPARPPGERSWPDPAVEGASDESAEPAADWLEIDIEDANVLDLCQAYARVMETVGQPPAVHELLYDDTPIALHAEDILDRLRRDGGLTLQEVFAGRASRSEMIGLFLATLELVRQGKIRVIQDELQEQVTLELIEAVAEGEPPPGSP